MMGAETGCFDEYSHEAWQEIGQQIQQGPPFMGGFHTQFEFIALRKVK
jgi:hypothetical protein